MPRSQYESIEGKKPQTSKSTMGLHLVSKQEQKLYSTMAKQEENIHSVQRRISRHQNESLNILKVETQWS